MKPVTKVVIGGSLLVLSGYGAYFLYDMTQKVWDESMYSQSLYGNDYVDTSSNFYDWNVPEPEAKSYVDVIKDVSYVPAMVILFTGPLVPITGTCFLASGIRDMNRKDTSDSDM